MQHHLRTASRQAVGHGRPLQHIQTIEPTHVDMVALALPVGIQVGHQNVHAQQMMIDVGDVQHVQTVAPIAMHQQGGALCGGDGRQIHGMEHGVALAAAQAQVVQPGMVTQAVEPVPLPGILAGLLLHHALHIIGITLRRERVTQHIITGQPHPGGQQGRHKQ